MHSAFEYIAATKGLLKIRVDGVLYEIKPGEAVLVFPEQIHSFESSEHACHRLVIFAPEYIKAFMPLCRDHVPQSSLFRPSEALFSAMETVSSDSGILRIKSILYLLADEFDSAAHYQKRHADEEKLLLRIFDFVGEHYSGVCTLKALSEALSYHYVYLSRYFSERTGISFSAYVGSYRIGESCYLLTNSDKSVTQIAFECGFDSLHTFHRHFKAGTGTTPMEYRSRYLSQMSAKA